MIAVDRDCNDASLYLIIHKFISLCIGLETCAQLLQTPYDV